MREHPAYRVDRFWEWRPAGGESLIDVQRRAAPVLERLLAEAMSGDVVVVSHGGVMLALCAHVEGDWTRPHVARNCEVLVVERGPAGLVLSSHADASTLGQRDSPLLASRLDGTRIRDRRVLRVDPATGSLEPTRAHAVLAIGAGSLPARATSAADGLGASAPFLITIARLRARRDSLF
jgi:broad specificity phosphatase PhoE